MIRDLVCASVQDDSQAAHVLTSVRDVMLFCVKELGSLTQGDANPDEVWAACVNELDNQAAPDGLYSTKLKTRFGVQPEDELRCLRRSGDPGSSLGRTGGSGVCASHSFGVDVDLPALPGQDTLAGMSASIGRPDGSYPVPTALGDAADLPAGISLQYCRVSSQLHLDYATASGCGALIGTIVNHGRDHSRLSSEVAPLLRDACADLRRNPVLQAHRGYAGNLQSSIRCVAPISLSN